MRVIQQFMPKNWRQFKAYRPLNHSDWRPRHGAYFSIIVGVFVSVLDATAINLLLPSIADDFNASTSSAILIINAYHISILVMLLPLAAIGERIGHSKVHLYGFALFTIASLLGSVVESLEALVTARILQGMGAAGIMSVNAALLRLSFPEALLGRKLAAISMAAAIASVSGPALASVILSIASWQWLFALKVPIGVIAILAGYGNFPHNDSQSPAFSGASLLLNTATFSFFFIGLSLLTSDLHENALLTGWIMIVIGVLLAGVYFRHQLRQPQPLFPLDLLRIRDFSLPIAASTGAYLALTIVHIGLPFTLLHTYLYDAYQASALLLAWPLAMILFSPLAGRLVGRCSDGAISSMGLLIFAVGVFSLALMSAQPTDMGLFWRIFLCGAGFALFHVPNNHSIVTATPLERSGSGSAMLSTSRLTGQSLGAACIAMLFVIWPGQNGRAENVGLFVAGGFAVASLLLGCLQARRS